VVLLSNYVNNAAGIITWAVTWVVSVLNLRCHYHILYSSCTSSVILLKLSGTCVWCVV